MSIVFPTRTPASSDPLDYAARLLDIEVDRGNDLCVIIEKLVLGRKLKLHEVERIGRILGNTSTRKRAAKRAKRRAKKTTLSGSNPTVVIMDDVTDTDDQAFIPRVVKRTNDPHA